MANQPATALICAIVFVLTTEAQPTMTMNMALPTLRWTITWDTRERDLSEDAGEGSEAAVVVDEDGVHIDGTLGFFRASAEFGKPLVAFVRTTALWTPMTPAIGRICVNASGQPAGLTIHLALESTYTRNQHRQTRRKGSYQTDFSIAEAADEFCFEGPDFSFVTRGVKQVAPPIALADVRSLGVLVTRSSQVGELSNQNTLVPFHITIHEISIRAN